MKSIRFAAPLVMPLAVSAGVLLAPAPRARAEAPAPAATLTVTAKLVEIPS